MKKLFLGAAVVFGGLLLSGCHTNFPGGFGFATWEFQSSHKKPAYVTPGFVDGKLVRDKYCVGENTN